MKCGIGTASAVLGALFLAACGSAVSDDEATGVSLDEIVGGTPASAYPEAAYLDIDPTATSKYVCSGTLIAPRVILTAGHCVDGHARWEVHVGSTLKVATTSAVYDWAEKGATTVNPNHHDIGLIFLNEPILLTSFPTLAKSAIPDGTKITNVGRILNGAVQNGLYQASTTMKDAKSIGFPYDYTSVDLIQPGDSGGPVFVADSHTIVAVNSGADGKTQVLARTDLLLDWITAQVVSHGGMTGTATAPATTTAKPSATAPATSAPAATSAKPSATAPATSPPAATSAKPSATAPATSAPAATSAKPSASAPATSSAPAPSTAPKPSTSAPATSAPATSSAPKPAAPATSTAPAATSAKPPTPAPSASSTTCMGTKESETNDAWTSANKVSGSVCAELSTASDLDWYSLSAAPGNHTFELVAAGDASAALGAVSGGTCVTSLSAAQKVNISVTGTTQTLCIKVSSASKKAQAYRINFN